MSGDLPELTHSEIEELLGAYALDAVDRPTAALIEAHLEGCVRCSIEVAQHHEVAGLLANSGGASPARLWDGIAGRLDEVSPPSWEGLAGRLVVGEDRTDQARVDDAVAVEDGAAVDGVVDDAVAVEHPRRSDEPDGGTTVVPLASRRRRRVAVLATAVAGVAAVLALVLGVQVHHLDNRVNALQARSTLNGAEQAALADPSSHRVALVPGPGATPPSGVNGKVTVVLTSSGTGFVEGAGLSALPLDRTYQLWGVIGGQAISLGLLGHDPGVVPFSVAGATSVASFVITAEHAGGVVHSTNQPVVSGAVTA
jgi:hypothetical protein